ncbi:MAG: DUF6585 family protein [Chloroflexota bacterium]
MDQLPVDSPFQPVIGMGRAQAVYKPGALSKILNALGCLIILAAGAYVFYYGLIYRDLFPNVADTNVPYILGFALIVLGGGAYWGWRILSRWNEMAVLYQNGFAHFSGRGDVVTSFKWNELTSITVRVTQLRVEHFIPAGKIQQFTFESPTAKLKLDGNLSRVEELVSHIRRNALPLMVNRMAMDLNSGQTLQFGPLSIHKTEGVQMKNKKYGWDEIAQMRVVNDILEILPKKRGLFSRIGVYTWKVPNLDAFFYLSDQLMKQSAQVQSIPVPPK